MRSETLSNLTNLHGLALALKLPARWLKAEAQAGRIPVLHVGHRLRFNIEAVERMLAERAAAASQDSEA